MSFDALMVYVEADGVLDQRVRLAASLAERFAAHLIGLSGLAVRPPVVANGVVLVDADDNDLMRATLADKGNWFLNVAGCDARKPEWRSALDFPTELLAHEARSADLVVIGQKPGPGGPYRSLDPGAAIVKMGRPTLVVPEKVSSVRGEHVVIGWSREARRAVRDALPFLQEADSVKIVQVCNVDEEKSAVKHLDDLGRYLLRHRIKADYTVMLEQKGSGAGQLIRIAEEERADLLVTGAYGHSRLGEWIFGGMTRDLLALSPVCCLFSN